MHEYRVAKVLCALVGSEWKTFDQIALDPSALEAKQLAGTLVAMRNRGSCSRGGCTERLVVRSCSGD